MKISKRFKTIRDFQLIRDRRKCWQKCALCNEELIKGNTEYVHMIVDKKEKCLFICDKCQDENNTTEI